MALDPSAGTSHTLRLCVPERKLCLGAEIILLSFFLASVLPTHSLQNIQPHGNINRCHLS
jgi:hypothetical protein